jgi:hypothetical protein
LKFPESRHQISAEVVPARLRRLPTANRDSHANDDATDHRIVTALCSA